MNFKKKILLIVKILKEWIRINIVRSKVRNPLKKIRILKNRLIMPIKKI